ncbi:chromosome segregation protein SMC [Catenovulum sediminis]|uniref:chromosome segregation protein SMC n=1 Tax=Catenovulum sediminis TaxID=1740262 RepID=UPI001180154F|nr:chromosome segregation protein SMC [Catenovulum sediminis]
MRLKQIKLAGFKSFVDPTTVPFPAQMTAIVGPNGCGKSNIIDAVRWVLGESSAKNLRGDAMTDVIFNGSSARKPVSQASIELVFDNSQGRIEGEFANYNEISVKRSVNRDPTSAYYLNGTKCRKKDITDLFLGTGLGPRSYAIIEQGMISRLIESKPQELRLFIEEAAGISKYKERRRETENRIRHTRDNLERLEDVLSELQQQIEKLQRQASAAKRYKELKAKERKLKAELSVLRWIRLNGQADAIGADIQTLELKLEEVQSHQRGDEAQTIKLRQQQFELRKNVEDKTQQLFSLAQDISKIEQTLLHQKEKKQNLQLEKSRLSDDLIRLNERAEQDSEHVEESKIMLQDLLPELELQQESLLEIEDALAIAEGELQQYSQSWEQKAREYYQLDNAIKAKQSQCQSIRHIMSTQQQRIAQAQQALLEFTEKQGADLEQLSEKSHITQARIETLQEQIAQTQDKLQSNQQKRRDLQLQANQCTEQLHQSKGQLSSFEALIKHQSEDKQSQMLALLAQQNIEHSGSVFTHIEVETGWEQIVSSVLSNWSNAVLTQQTVPVSLEKNEIGIALFSENCSSHRSLDLRNTLAEKVVAPQGIKQILGKISITEDAIEFDPTLLPEGRDSWVDSSGNWCGLDWQIQIKAQQDNIFLLQHKQQIESENVAMLAQQLDALTEKLDDCDNHKKQLENELSEFHNQQYALKNELTRIESELTSAEQQLAFKQAQIEKLTTEIEQNQQQLAIDEERVEILEDEVEEEQHQLLALEAENNAGQSTRGTLQNQVSDTRAKKEKAQTLTHQLQLKVEQSKHTAQTSEQALRLSQEKIVELQDRLEELTARLIEIDEPLDEYAIELQQLLEDKAQTELEKTELQEQLQDVDEQLSVLEKDQHGIMAETQKLKDQIAQLKIDQEGYRVRAKSVIEVLSELETNVREVAQQLPADAQEQAWEQELSKTSQSINRLGAINLAAIDEYEHQSQRKEYLDAQHLDLIAALNTLEDAIRKIDKETKSKFRDTFEAVNSDLKALFPKVFGGGAAWLELTDDDLLDTGVTIMARPPGKRNSTIHLLSGGEKALTALSLVFAIFRLNPAPFCMLDEVDAPLDDANVGRFCRLVQEMSSSVQFVFISHNKIAMEMATHLVGVTMQEPGVSRMVAVDIEKAIELAELD